MKKTLFFMSIGVFGGQTNPMKTLQNSTPGHSHARNKQSPWQPDYTRHPEGSLQKCVNLPSPLRRFFGLKPFIADCLLPSGVTGPVLHPPCSLQRPFAHKSRRLQGVPLRVLAGTFDFSSFFLQGPCGLLIPTSKLHFKTN